MEIRSEVFGDGGKIPKKYTCEGEDVNPPLNISGVPEGAESLVLIMYDPDVPKEVKEDQNFDHWVLFNVSANVSEMPENSVPEGATEGVNTAGSSKYVGPCPPKQFEPTEHRYVFEVSALDKKLELSEGSSRNDVEQEMEGHVLDKAEIVGKYEKES